MKSKFYCALLIAEAAACVAFAVARASFSGIFSAAMAFPFEQIGLGLRALSLSGGAGNAAALAIYVILGLLPLSALPILRKRRGLFAEDGLLGLLSAAVFFNLYFMINPGIMGAMAGGMTEQAIGKAVLGGIVYSIICGYFVLRALRLFFHSAAQKLMRYMSIMLGVLGVCFIYLVFGACFGGMLESVALLRAGNAGNESLLGASYVFLALQFAVNALPYVFDLLVIFAAFGLLAELQADRYSAETVAAAERVSRLCITALTVTALTNIGFNVLQLLFIKTALIINISVNVPVISIAFVLAALLLTRFIAENKKLKDDNDLFI